jgi:hypothetical protein
VTLDRAGHRFPLQIIMARTAKVGTVELTPQFIEMLQQWETIAKQAKELKAAEFALRQQIVSQIGDPTKLEGTEKVALGAGYILESKQDSNLFSHKQAQ